MVQWSCCGPTEFEVVYSDEDEVYQFDLLADYREGDLKLVV